MRYIFRRGVNAEPPNGPGFCPHEAKLQKYGPRLIEENPWTDQLCIISRRIYDDVVHTYFFELQDHILVCTFSKTSAWFVVFLKVIERQKEKPYLKTFG